MADVKARSSGVGVDLCLNGAVRLARCCDRRDWCDQRGATIDETGGVWVVELELNLWLSDWSLV